MSIYIYYIIYIYIVYNIYIYLYLFVKGCSKQNDKYIIYYVNYVLLREVSANLPTVLG